MSAELDTFDVRILAELQCDATLSMDDLAQRAHLSRNACWRRIKRMEAEGLITGRVVLLDAEKLGYPLTAMVMIKASAHQPDWLDSFHKAVRLMPQIIGAYRMTGDLDYLLRVQLRDMADYDAFYKSLIARVPMLDISASFVMEHIKDTTAMPLPR